MTASDDAREVLAQDASALRVRQAHRLARTLLALTGEQAVEAAARALYGPPTVAWDEASEHARSYYRYQATTVLAAALAAAEEAS